MSINEEYLKVEESVYKGSPVIRFLYTPPKGEERFSFALGLRKGKTVLGSVKEIGEFVKKHEVFNGRI